jgi:8-amino-7-oxononanoate synthase
MPGIAQHLEKKLAERESAGNLRQLSTQHATVDFFSNDYLGLATNGIITAALKDIQPGAKYSGSTGSRLLSGNTLQVLQLEDKISAFHKAEAALVFNSGYDANIGLITSVANRHTVIIYDELCHASIIDGIRLAQCKDYLRFKHNDAIHLGSLLQSVDANYNIMVVVESIYSMDGDAAHLAEFAALCEKHNASLIVDEAHATGVIGKRGEGLVCHLGLEEKVFARVHTFGKALGCHGAAVVGSKLLKDYLVNFARSFIYTTALPLHSVYAIEAAYDHLSSPGFSNESLHELITYFRSKINDSKANWKDSESPIQALIAGDNAKAKTIATKLQQAGLQVNAILHPTVPLGEERLRVCLHTFNTKEQIDTLFSIISAEI